jgi:hypothetical protein
VHVEQINTVFGMQIQYFIQEVMEKAGSGGWGDGDLTIDGAVQLPVGTHDNLLRAVVTDLANRVHETSAPPKPCLFFIGTGVEEEIEVAD